WFNPACGRASGASSIFTSMAGRPAAPGVVGRPVSGATALCVSGAVEDVVEDGTVVRSSVRWAAPPLEQPASTTTVAAAAARNGFTALSTPRCARPEGGACRTTG